MTLIAKQKWPRHSARGPVIFLDIDFYTLHPTGYIPQRHLRRATVMEAPWTKSPHEILEHFGVDSNRGLSSDQAAKHAEIYGKNGMFDTNYILPPSYCIILKQNCLRKLQRHSGS
jgi:hypothetical protein